jgi:SAM-dependent methyltransferase
VTAVLRIEVGARHFLLYLLLPHPLKQALLSPGSRARLDRINRAARESVFGGEAATAYDVRHRYEDEAQHEYPARALVEEVWAPGGYGHALELGAGSGYFTVRIARRARSLLALEPAPDMARVLRERCAAAGVGHVRVLEAVAQDLDRHVAPASVDSALVVQSFHHFHRRPEVIRSLARALRPGGRLFMVEPHHNLRRAARLLGKYLTTYRPRRTWRDENAWATHDFLTRGEIRTLCRAGGFEDARIQTYWYPYGRRLVPDPARRLAWERRLGRVPGLRHLAAVLAVEARRAPDRGA